MYQKVMQEKKKTRTKPKKQVNEIAKKIIDCDAV